MSDFVEIKGYEGLYAVNPCGEIKSLSRIVICSNGQKKPVKEKIISPGDNGSGYKFVYLWKNNESKRKYVHRIVAETFIPNPDNLAEINHKDGNKCNNTVTNLEWCNRLYNEKSKKKHISGKRIKIKQTNVITEDVTIYDCIADCCRAFHTTHAGIHRIIDEHKVITNSNGKYKLEYDTPKYKKLKITIEKK